MASGHVNRTNRPNTWLHRLATRREDFSLPTRSRPHMAKSGRPYREHPRLPASCGRRRRSLHSASLGDRLRLRKVTGRGSVLDHQQWELRRERRPVASSRQQSC